MAELTESVESQKDALDRQIESLRNKRTPCSSGVEPKRLSAEQYRDIAQSKPLLEHPRTVLQVNCTEGCTELTAAVQGMNSTDIAEKQHSGMTAEKARKTLNNAHIKEYVEPTQEEVQQNVLKATGRQITLDTDNRANNPKTSHDVASVSEKTADKVSAYLCAAAIYRTNQLRYLDSPETTSVLYRFDGRIWTPMTHIWLKTTITTTLTTEEKTSIHGFVAFLKNVREFLLALAAVDYDNGNRFTDDDFARIKNHAVFLNCVYDAAEGQILPHSSDLPYERLIHVDYNPEDKPTPVYNQIVKFATGDDPDSKDMFDYAIGYLAVPNQTGKCFFYLGDAPDSGKSILSDSINKCFGSYAYKVDPENLAGRFSYEKAGFARLYCCSDMRKTELSETVASQFKRNTGDRVIRIEGKYQSEEQITVRFKMMLVSNFPLLIKNAQRDEAFYRRVIVLPFIQSVAPEDRDSTLEENLPKEMSAVFSKCVRRLHEIINKDGGIVFPESKLSSRIKESWHAVTDMVNEFLDQTVQVAKCFPGEKPALVRVTELHTKYEEYMAEATTFSGKKIGCNLESFKKKVTEKYDTVYLDRARPTGYKNPVSCFVNLEYKNYSD